MATLNTLRTRFGVVLSAIIAFALLAFIFSLKSEMGFAGNEPIVAKIDGHNVTYTEYQNEYNSIQQMNGVDGSSEQQVNMLYSQTWQTLFTKFALVPALANMGVEVTDSERMSIVRGEIPTQTMYGAFADPQTGVYNANAVNNFLLSSQGNPEAEAMWTMINEQACTERLTTKFASLVAAGANVNSLEVKRGVEAANKSFAGRWVMRSYRDIADSLVTVSNSDVKRYYDEHKETYKRLPSRSVSYVEFKIEPSAADLAKLESEAQGVAADFAAAEDVRAFIRSNRNGSVTESFLSAAQLIPAEAADLTAGKTYGATNSGDSWRMSRVAKSLTAPDTLSIRHIVLSYSDRDLADSLLVALRKGGDFAQAAASYSVYSQTAQNGGDLGKLPFAAFTDEFAGKLAVAKRGDIVEIESGDMIQLMQVYEVGKRIKHYQVASIDIPILPSDETRRAAHNAAGLFAVAAKKAEFKDAAGESNVMPRSADLTSASRIIAGVAGSAEVARWAHRAEVGDLSEIFKVDDGYVVATLTKINDSDYRELSEVEASIKSALMRDKKFDMIVADPSASSLDAQAEAWDAEIGTFEGVNFGSTYVRGMGVEPRVIGAISVAAAGSVSEPIKGNAGAFRFEVTEVVDAAEPQTEADEKVRAEAMSATMVQQMLYNAVESLSDVEDLRGQSL